MGALPLRNSATPDNHGLGAEIHFLKKSMASKGKQKQVCAGARCLKKK